ncbi:hypothetical protein [Streptomyces sp. RK62]|uniref:hypothetical protein n=1 Tax=Streptomyces sp. RK62 TaxID=2824893 RepID=UPI001B37B323|nr:hypothetical protein [Streptomyces sp. RK62]MBQ0996295.1 hypothetical protein [Streptomyces sp. RK62]
MPGDFCQIPGTIRLADAEATATSRTWGRVHIGLLPKRLYGDVTGDGRAEAALNVGCDNGGGTAAGQLAFAVVVITAKNGMLRSLGSLGAQHDSPGVHTPLLSATKLERDQVTVTESWYRPSDSTCCPTGTDVSTWTFGADGKLSVVNSRTTS